MPTSLLTVGPLQASINTVQPFATSGISTLVPVIPSDFTGLVGWWDASQITGIASGASLSVWTDLSGSGNHLTQPSAASQPIFLSGIQNGSVVSSAGATSSMTAGFTLAQPVTIALVARFVSSVTIQKDIVDGITAASMILGPITGADLQMFGGTAVIDSLVSLSAGSWIVCGGIFSGATSVVFSGSTSSTGNAGTASPNGISVFARADKTFPTQAQIGEIVLYSQRLGATSLSQITTYLRAKWGVTT